HQLGIDPVLRCLSDGGARRVRGEKDREHAKQQVSPQPTYEGERDVSAEAEHLALRLLPATHALRRTSQRLRFLAQLAHGGLHIEEVRLALRRASVVA